LEVNEGFQTLLIVNLVLDDSESLLIVYLLVQILFVLAPVFVLYLISLSQLLHGPLLVLDCIGVCQILFSQPVLEAFGGVLFEGDYVEAVQNEV